MSLADKLEMRHREPVGSEGSDQGGVTATLRTSEPEAPVKASGIGSANGHAKPPKFALNSLPQLKPSSVGLGTSQKAPTWPVPQAEKVSGAANESSGPRLSLASSAVTATTSVETHVSRSAVLEAVQATSRATNVQIEITKGAGGHTTFMLKGSPEAVKKAKPLLAAQLAPRIDATVRIPSSARSAVIGARGANLRKLSQNTHCKIDLDSVSTPWSLDLTDVKIQGTSDGVELVRAAVLDAIDQNRSFNSSRPISPLLARFLQVDTTHGANVTVQHDRISVQGAFEEVLSTMNALDELIHTLTANYVTQPLSLSSQRQVLGHNIPEDIVFEEHGVLVTPQGELFGPSDRLSGAASAVESYLSSLKHTILDISQAHNRNEAHARVLARYITATRAVPQISEQYGVKITEPAQGECIYEIVGEEKATQQARKALVSIVNTHGPSTMAVVRGMRSPLIRTRASEISQVLKGNVKAIIGPTDELYLVFEDPGDDFAPTADEIHAAVQEAVAAFNEVIELSRKVVTKTINLDEDSKYIASPRGEEAKALYAELIESRPDVHCEVSGPTAVISGLQVPVSRAVEMLPRIVALSKEYLVRASFTQEIQFEQALLRNLIGRGGAQIQSYRDQFGVSVEADDNGRVIVQGIESQAKAAAKAIADLQRRLRDEQTERLAIPGHFHVKLIGPKGKHVKRLSEKYDVSIKFPKRAPTTPDSTESSRSDSRGETPEAEADVIVIRGPSKGVAAVKREFMDLVAYERAQSYSQTIRIPSKVMPRLVGRQGIVINGIKHESGAQIDIDKEADDNGDIAVVVTGEQKRVSQAISLISSAADELLDQTERSIEIEPEYHRLLTGPSNVIRRQIIADAGGDVDAMNRTLIIPPSHLNSSTIKLSGRSKVVDAMEAHVRRIVSEEQRRSQASSTVNIPIAQHRLLIGPQGRLKRAAEQRFSVQITIPRDKDSEIVTVRGEHQKDVDAAIKHLQDLASVAQGTESVPSPIWTSRLKRKLADKFGVKGEGKFAAPSVEKPDSGFSVAPLSNSSTSQIKLTGKSQEDVDNAGKFLSDLAAKADTVGYLWLEGRQVRKAVGAGGQNVNSVRSNTGCLVEIPDDAQVAPIVIVGADKDVEEARRALLKFTV